MTVALACTAAFAAAVPGSALAAKHRKQAAKHQVHHAVAAPQPTIVVPHRYDAGGDGADLTPLPGVPVKLFNPLEVATGLGNTVLAQLGLPPLPPL
jgi:hypothetical protein